METAGFKWQPEICPTANAIVNTVRPKASDTPKKPIPVFGKVAARTALPQPPRTNQKVPMNSATSFLIILKLSISLKKLVFFVGYLLPSVNTPQK
jgi:hypothetical protein